MPCRAHFPELHSCCGCVTDLKAAVAIIAALGIVTSPVVSWAVVRHSYVIRVSCYITTTESRPDIMDINLNNILSFGFGANAGLRPSCLSPMNVTEPKTVFRTSTIGSKTSTFLDIVKFLGWVVLIADIIFVVTSILFLIKIFAGPDIHVSKYFMWAALLSITLSFTYGMLFVTACVIVGGAFPIYEFVFSVIDLIVWIYFLMVVQSYRRKTTEPVRPN